MNVDEILAAKLIGEYEAVIVAIGQQASPDPGIPGGKARESFTPLII